MKNKKFAQYLKNRYSYGLVVGSVGSARQKYRKIIFLESLKSKGRTSYLRLKIKICEKKL